MPLKRILAAAVAIVLVLSICIIPASAAEIIFIAVNDTIPNALNEAAMPFYQDDQLYIPYTTFNNSALGVVPSYNTQARTLTLSNNENSLIFDIQGGTVTENDSVMFPQPILIRYGILFVPADYTASFFGISVSYLVSKGGYAVVRLKTGEEVYGDSLFIEKAENLISYRIEQYHPAVDPNPPSQPQTDPDSSDNPDENPDPEPDDNPGTRYQAMAVMGISDSILNELDRNNVQTPLFLTTLELQANRDLVRRAVCSGYRIGVNVLHSDDPAADTEEFNRILDQILLTKTLLVLCRADQEAYLEGYFAFAAPEEESRTLLLLDQETLEETLAGLRADWEIPPGLRETTVLYEPSPEEEDEEIPIPEMEQET